MTSSRHHSGSIALVTAGAVMISFAAVFVRLADVAPTTSGFYRMLFGSIGLLVLIGVQPRLHRGFGDGWLGSALIAASRPSPRPRSTSSSQRASATSSATASRSA